MENVHKMHEQANTDERPRPLMRELPPPDPFPVEALGHVLSDAAKAIHDKTQAPMAICCQSVIAAVTLAAQGQVDIKLPTGGRRPISNYFMTIAASGERKTACDEIALAPMRAFEKHLRQEYDKKMPEYENAKAAWDSARKYAEKKAQGNKEALKKALDAIGPAPASPHKPIIVCTEPTFEGLCRLYMEGRPSLGVYTAEGGQFVGGHGMNEDSKLRTASGFSLLWDGEPIRRVRAIDGSFVLPGRRCSMHLMVQPEVATIMLGDAVLKDQGYLSRMLVTAPASTAGTRYWKEEQADNFIRLATYEEKLFAILEKPLALARGKNNELEPLVLPLSQEAKEKWTAYVNDVESKLVNGGLYEPVRGLANKLPEHAARLAAVLVHFDNPLVGEIDAESMVAGIALANHYAAEALRLFGNSRISGELWLARQLLEWLQTSYQGELISLPDMYQYGPNAIRDSGTAAKIAKVLQDHSWLVKQDGCHVVNGHRRKDVWRIIKIKDD
jgi:hypothetical protein